MTDQRMIHSVMPHKKIVNRSLSSYPAKAGYPGQPAANDVRGYITGLPACAGNDECFLSGSYIIRPNQQDHEKH
jgi:hypothetical protein